jgi:hypothetical protein
VFFGFIVEKAKFDEVQELLSVDENIMEEDLEVGKEAYVIN